MSWKEFLKPSGEKIVLTIIIYFLMIFIPFLFPDYWIKIFTRTIYPFPKNLLLELPNIIWTYFLSCLIFWIYNKVKKK